MPDFKTDKALVLSARHLGERSFIISILTRDKGRHLGVYQKKTPPEIGTFVSARWQARLSEQLGSFYLEETTPFSSSFLDDRARLACIVTLCALLDDILPERQSFPEVYDDVFEFLAHLEDPCFLENYIRLEVSLLSAIGFGLDLTSCAGGGNSQDLAYVSPRTGRAVSREKGKPYHNKLLSLPRFLWQPSIVATPEDLKKGLRLTGYFLETYATQKPLPKVRERLFRFLEK